MSYYSPLLLAFLSPLAVIILTVYRLFFHPLHHVPGPLLARITELWRTSRYFQGTWHDDILSLHRRYGSVVRIAPNEVSVVHPDLASTVYSYQRGTKKTDWYDTWKALGGSKSNSTANSFFNTTNPHEHAFLRKRVSSVYSMSYILSLDAKIQPVLDSFLDKVSSLADAKSQVNLSHWSSYFTYDVVGKLCLGQQMGFIENGEDKDNFIQTIHDTMYWCANMGHLPGQAFPIMHPAIVRLGQLLGLRETNWSASFVKMCVGHVLDRTKAASPEERKAQQGDTDMLDHFLAMKDPTGRPASMSAIMAEIGNLLAAGADTTSVAVKAVLGPILRDRVRYRRLQDELLAAVLSSTSMNGKENGQILPYSVQKDLPFLSACIEEGFRMHPSIVYQLPRKAPAEGITFDGYFIPSSATISMSPLAQNRCKSIFGTDADKWRPERWIAGEGSSEKVIKGMERNLASFGYGSRTCIGRNLATYEIYKFVS
ncbi:cytochrome P450 [Aspergillus karnatakaensis]|uniref:cytochrome P450 n=1 Tax=Aspergillus karnatakaensis TaxID=1810916 RepID=UPI003CCCC4E8